jgi:hypothetical protein
MKTWWYGAVLMVSGLLRARAKHESFRFARGSDRCGGANFSARQN